MFIKALQLVILSFVTLICFAGNSLLCRFALRTEAIDPVPFTLIRLFSGALILSLLVLLKPSSGSRKINGSWKSGAALFIYAAGFSLAYVSLSAATGALILFGCVQGTMIIAGYRKGERLGLRQWIGCAIAIAGLLVLLMPGLSTPPLASAALMAIAGVAWGIYSLLGKSFSDPLAATTGNFLRALPFALVLGLMPIFQLRNSPSGILLAVLSGAVTSGLGYAIWYRVLPNLKSTTAAIIQLSVPVLATIGGVVLLGEVLTWQVAISSALTLFGISLVILKFKKAT